MTLERGADAAENAGAIRSRVSRFLEGSAARIGTNCVAGARKSGPPVHPGSVSQGQATGGCHPSKSVLGRAAVRSSGGVAFAFGPNWVGSAVWPSGGRERINGSTRAIGLVHRHRELPIRQEPTGGDALSEFTHDLRYMLDRPVKYSILHRAIPIYTHSLAQFGCARAAAVQTR